MFSVEQWHQLQSCQEGKIEPEKEALSSDLLAAIKILSQTGLHDA